MASGLVENNKTRVVKILIGATNQILVLTTYII